MLIEWCTRHICMIYRRRRRDHVEKDFAVVCIFDLSLDDVSHLVFQRIESLIIYLPIPRLI